MFHRSRGRPDGFCKLLSNPCDFCSVRSTLHQALCKATSCFATSIMSIRLEVGLLSGKTATVQASLSDTVQTLKRKAQISLGVGRGQLLAGLI